MGISPVAWAIGTVPGAGMSGGREGGKGICGALTWAGGAGISAETPGIIGEPGIGGGGGGIVDMVCSFVLWDK